MVARHAAALTFVLAAGCLSMAELDPPSLRPEPPQAEAPPDTLVEPQATYPDTDPSALTDFRPLLDHYGIWVEDAAFGTVWVPDAFIVGTDFIPYATAGRWAYKDDYTWVSDYSWGWLPFHYGRWVWIEGRRWAWIPGRAYAPAWVVWRTSPADVGYVGWAPMPPAFTWRTIPIDAQHANVGGMVAVSVAPIIEASFVFCPASNLFAKDVSRWIVAGPPGFAIARRSEPFDRRDAAPDTPLAQAFEHGPAPAEIGVRTSAIRPPSPKDEGLASAKRWALPSTVPTSARAPSRHWVRVAPPVRLPSSNAPHTYRLTF